VVIGTGRASLQPEGREQAVEAAVEMQKRAIDEPGCSQYRVWVGSDDPGASPARSARSSSATTRSWWGR